MGKDSFIIYNSFYPPISDLSDEQLGRLFRAIFEYNISGQILVDNDIKMAFYFFKNQIDVDSKKYNERIERNRENGRKGGNKKAENQKVSSKSSKCYRPLANASECKRNLANLADNDNDNVNDNDKKEIELSNDNPKKKSFDLSFVSSEYMEAFQEWLDYKKARKETYQTQMGVKKCYSHLLKLCEGNPAIAKQIVDQSIANNWAGLFELKTPGKVSAHPTGESGSNGLKLGKGERFENGRRTYGTGIANIPLNAPPRPSEQYFWNADNQQWAIA